MTKTNAGHYYGIDFEGRMHDIGTSLGDAAPDRVICRRVADYPTGRLPREAGFADCSRCGARIAFNPRGPHQSVPKSCMQCAGVEPLPFPEP